ncbi:GNAT family N-acetyltransferase [Priestia sp. FSL R5-0597]|uniref:GNAT family N-acetyltransferase n=1 Tax=Priestia TaxID=2800373 RepID=UPI0012B8BAB4|nr:GNAT family N-acetyltransferase [Priestia megaterium]
MAHFNVDIVHYHPQFAEATVKMWRDSKEKAIGQKEMHSFDRHIYFLDHILSAHYKVELALIDEQIVGMVAYNADEINQLYIHIDYQGGGIGQRLLERAKAESNGKLTLCTFEQNKNAQRFYEKHGFSIIKRGGENEEKLPDITYEWTNK